MKKKGQAIWPFFILLNFIVHQEQLCSLLPSDNKEHTHLVIYNLLEVFSKNEFYQNYQYHLFDNYLDPLNQYHTWKVQQEQRQTKRPSHFEDLNLIDVPSTNMNS